MFFGYGRPTGVTWTVSGTGAAILSPATQLDDNRPGTVTRLQWLSGAQTTSSVMRLRADWSGAAIVPRIVGLSNASLPAGTKITASFRRTSDTAGTYPYTPTAYNATQRIIAGPRGEQFAWILLPDGATPITGVEIQIYNDVNGTARILAGAQFTIGEAVVMAGIDANIQQGSNTDEIDPTTVSYSTFRQPYAMPGSVYRQLSFKMVVDVKASYLATYRSLFANLDRGQTGMYVTTYKDGTGTFSADVLHQNAMLGVATKLPGAIQKDGQYFDSNTVVVQETPIPA